MSNFPETHLPPAGSPAPSYGPVNPPAPREEAGSKKLVCGLLAIFLNCLGIHKFILGYTSAGLIMLLVSLLTCGIGAIPMTIIGFVEGILYLSKTDQQFYDTYMVRRREWF